MNDFLDDIANDPELDVIAQRLKAAANQPDSIPDTKGGSCRESNSGSKTPIFTATPASELGPGEEIDFIVEGYVSPGHSTLITAIWKGGKSTLLAHAIKAMEHGGDIGVPVHPAKVLVVTEESEAIWAMRRDELSFGDHVSFVCRPFMGRPYRKDWEAFAQWIAEGDWEVVIIDTLPAVSPVTDENDATKVLEALSPLTVITKANKALVLVSHIRKSDGNEGTATRGSGALPGWVDIIVEMRRYDPERKGDPRRVLTGLSRFASTPDELVIELTDGGYVSCGTRTDAGRDERLDAMKTIIDGAEIALTPRGIHERWKDKIDDIPRPSLRCIERDLYEANEAGIVDRSGTGKKGDPYAYRWREIFDSDSKCDSRQPHALVTRNESESVREAI